MNNSDTPSVNLARLETAMRGLRRAFMAAKEQFSSGLQISRTQLEILMLLIERPGQTTGELASQLGLTQSAVTQTVDTLVRRDMVERTPDEHDRRIIRLQLSASGNNVMTEMKRERSQRLEEILSRLSSAEFEDLVAATEKLTAFIEAAPHIKPKPSTEK